MTIVFDQDEPTAEVYLADLYAERSADVARFEERGRRRHTRARHRRRRLDRLVVGLVAVVLALSSVLAALLVHGTPGHPTSTRLTTTDKAKVLPTPAPAPSTIPPVFNAQGLVVPPGTPGAVPADAGPPATITVGGTSAPNPLMQADQPGVSYAGANYYGAPQAGVGPMETVPGYGLNGCALYVGRQQIGYQFPGSVNVGGTVKTYQCNPSITPASIPKHP